MAYAARVLLDSAGPAGVRLTTLEVTFPRFVLAEFNTHRSFCLDGETQLYFDLPKKGRGCATTRFPMSIREFYEKWHLGAAPRQNPRRSRLAAMELRSCDEVTGAIYHTRVTDVAYSGKKPVFRVKLTNGQQIVASEGHRFLTQSGWQRLEDAVGLKLSSGGIATWSKSASLAVNGAPAYRDPNWLQAQRDAGLSARAIAEAAGVTVDQVKRQFRKHGVVATNPALAWTNSLPDYTQLGRPFCEFWNLVGSRVLRKPLVRRRKRAMLRHFVPIESIEYAGVRDTYDIEVEGPFHNFVANGFIVHNSRNSASSRAIPTSKLIDRVELDPVLPLEWGRNKAGMSASDVLTPQEEDEAKRIWLSARDAAVAHARRLMDLKVHKQELNRVLEPFLWHTVIVTATEWENFFELRCAAAAQPEIRAAATRMRDAIAASEPSPVGLGAWHLPLVQPDERALPVELQKQISAARCARVSYLTHDGTRELEKDLELHDRLKVQRHLSPFEHVATPAGDVAFHANFRAWRQMRAEVEAGARTSPVTR